MTEAEVTRGERILTLLCSPRFLFVLLAYFLGLVWFLFAPTFLERLPFSVEHQLLAGIIAPVAILGGVLYPAPVFRGGSPIVRIVNMFILSVAVSTLALLSWIGFALLITLL